MKKMLLSLASGWLVAVALSACATPPEPEPVATPDPNQPVSSSDPTPTPEPTVNPDSVDAVILESFPLQVMAAVNSNLPDGCTEIYDSHVERTDNAFSVTLTTARPTDAECTEALVPYQENIPLDVYGLPAGDYTVTVNGVSAGFTFAQDNGPLEDTVVVPPPRDETHMEINPALINEVQVRTEGTASGGPELVIRGAAPVKGPSTFGTRHGGGPWCWCAGPSSDV